MADALTQAQIDAMLSSAMAGESIEMSVDPTESVKNYDFRAPKKLTKERMKVLDSIFGNYARAVSSYLTGLLRVYCKVTLALVEEQKYFEFNNTLPDYVVMGILSLRVDDDEIDDVTTIVQFSDSASYIMIDRLLGGKGEYVKTEERDFTEIEISVMRGIINNMSNMMREPWANYVNLTPVLEKIETNSRVVSNIGYDDTMIIVALDVEINDVKSIVSVCIPALELDGVMQKYATFNARGVRKSDAVREGERKDSIMTTLSQSLLNVTAVLGETNLDMVDVMNLQAGDIIPLGKNIDGNIALNVGGQTWFDGKLGVFNSKKAIKIENVLRDDLIEST